MSPSTKTPTKGPTMSPTGKACECTNCLYQQLCNANSDGKCVFENEVELSVDAECQGKECDVDTVTVIEVDLGIFYEFVPEPCVNQAFYHDVKKITKPFGGEMLCADPNREIASTACCEWGSWEWIDATRSEEYWGELMKFDTAASRCDQINKPLCKAPSLWKDCTIKDEYRSDCMHEPYYWTSDECILKVKVDPNNGKIAIVHNTGDGNYNSERASHTQEDSLTYFRVHWISDNFPTPANSCGGTGQSCTVYDGACLCDTSVEDSLVFSAMPSKEDVLKELHIGSFDPSILELNQKYTANDVTVYYKNGQPVYSIDSVFEVLDYAGNTYYLKNIKSIVSAKGSSMFFRNPPHFLNLDTPKLRDAEYETNAALDQYIYHENTAPFLAHKLIQRFGISNPSPNYVKSVAIAFRSGLFESEQLTFGSEKYGDLAATVAALLLHSEARSVVLDADPSQGALREPLLKFISIMRSMEYKANDDSPLIEFHKDVVHKIGQMAYDIPTVFSFFLPNYQPLGPITIGSLVSPEAQLLTTPNTISTLNGLFSLIKYGFSYVWGGVSLNRWREWENPEIEPGNYDYSLGHLTFTPSSANPKDVVQELSTLLTSGRLSSESQDIIESTYRSENQDEMALKIIQQLIVTTPEFHGTGLVHKSGNKRSEYAAPDASDRIRKSLVFLILNGGTDSFNMLVPECQSLKSQYTSKRAELALSPDELIPISVNLDPMQPCAEFSLHYKLEFLQKSYNKGKTLFFANTGVLNAPCNKDNYWEVTRTGLFGHNTMQEEAQRVDPYQIKSGTGVLGRMLDVLADLDQNKGGPYHVGSISIDQDSFVLKGGAGAPAPITVGAYGPTKFDPYPWSDLERGADTDLFSSIQALNDANTVDSSYFGETWSSKFLRGIGETELLERSANVELKESFSDNHFSRSLEQIAKLIKTEDVRGVDRSVYFVEHCCYDHHSNLRDNLQNSFEELNGGLDTFWKEMESQGNEENVILVAVSDFARTLTPNSSSGSDHAWGGHYFMMGGKVKGGRIVGAYPDDLDGPLNVDGPNGRGRLIPTTSWDAIWNGVCQHMGVVDETDLDYIIPNRHDCGSELFDKNDLFIED